MCRLKYTFACYVVVGEWEVALSSAEEAKTIDPTSVKALFRAGVANRHMGNFDKSKADLRSAVELDPKDKYDLLPLHMRITPPTLTFYLFTCA